MSAPGKWPAYPHNRCYAMEEQGTTVLLFLCQSAGCSSGPFCQDQDHFTLSASLARTTFLGQSSVLSGLGGVWGLEMGTDFALLSQANSF